MGEKFSFKESVIDYLPNAFYLIMMSLNNETLAYQILTEVSEEFLRIHPINLKKIQDQNNSDYKSSKQQSASNRKQARRRRYHPTGAYLFYFLIKERIAIEERKQEILGVRLSKTAILFRFFHKLFENDNLSTGAFVPIAAMYGILYDFNPHVLARISSHFHGIDEAYDYKHRDFRKPEYFAETGAKLIVHLTERFKNLDFFKEILLQEQPFHNELKEHIIDSHNQFIEFQPADEETIKTVNEILRRLSPWGYESILPDDVPGHNLRYNRIESLVFNKNSSLGEREIEVLRIKSLMNPTIMDVLLSNESIRRRDMIKKFLVPVLKYGHNYADETMEVVKYKEEFTLQLALNQLAKPMGFKELGNFSLSIMADEKELGTIDSTIGEGKLNVPVKARKLNAVAKIIKEDKTETSVTLATILLGGTDLAYGEDWINEWHFENKRHLSLRLIPVLDSSENLKSISLYVNYHTEEKCLYSQKKSLFEKVVSKIYKLKPRLDEFVQKPIEDFLHSLQAVKLFSESDTRKNVIKNTLTYAVKISLMTIVFVTLFLMIGKTLPNLTILFVSMILVSLGFILTALFSRQNGINKIFQLCIRLNYFSGITTLVILALVFTNLLNKSSSFKEIISSNKNLLSQSEEINILSRQYLEDKLGNVKNAFDLAAIKTTEAQTPLLSDPVASETKVVERKVIDVVNVKMSTIKYVSEPINVEKVKIGDSFESHMDEPEVASNKDNLDIIKRVATSLRAKIVSVDRGSSLGNEVRIKFKIDAPPAGESKLPVNEEVQVIFESYQKLTQIALFWKEGESMYAKPFSVPPTGMENPQEKPNLTLIDSEVLNNGQSSVIPKEVKSDKETKTNEESNSGTSGNAAIVITKKE